MSAVEPYRIVLVIQAAHADMSVVEGALGGLIDDALARGFAYEWAIMTKITDSQSVLEVVQAIVDGRVTPEDWSGDAGD